MEHFLRHDLNVIELGGSSGIVSSHIVRKMGSKTKFIVVEMNTDLLESLKTNIQSHNINQTSVVVLNKAISYTKDHIYLETGTNSTETSTIGNAKDSGDHKIPATRLAEIVNLLDNGDYALVSDIEGAEAEILNEESSAFDKCRQIIIELHHTVYKGKHFSVADLRDLILSKHGFTLVEQDGFVFYFTKDN